MNGQSLVSFMGRAQKGDAQQKSWVDFSNTLEKFVKLTCIKLHTGFWSLLTNRRRTYPLRLLSRYSVLFFWRIIM